MYYENTISNAIETVLSWDIPDAVFADAVQGHIGMLPD